MFVAFLLMQFIISTKAGLVNYVDGQVNVHLHEQVPAGTPIQTGPHSHVELLLNPGSFLRLDENSTVVFDSVELTNIAVRLIEGAALIETAEINKETRIRVTTGNLKVLIASPGLYRFSDDTASVLDGKVLIDGSSRAIKKGREITSVGGNYLENAAIRFSDGLDLWSRQRSSDLARANAMAYHERPPSNGYTFGGYPLWGVLPLGSTWLYSPPFGGFTFIPVRTYRSYYGYRFFPLSGFVRHGLNVGRTVSTSRSSSRTVGAPTRGSAIGSSGTSRPSYGGRMGGHVGGGHGRR